MSITTNDGGPAFPSPDLGEQDFNQRGAYPGMSLRDYFAAMAMGNMFARNRQRELVTPPEQVAADSYAMADAMLATRAKAQPADPVRDAAPEMLEALIELSKSFIGTYSSDPRSDREIGDHKERWEMKARAAIAKATGGAA